MQPELNQFLRKCRDRGILVGLSSWFQKDLEEANLMIPSPGKLGEIWKKTLDTIAADGLLDVVLYVDLCNEWPFKVWAPFFNLDGKAAWKDALSLKWMREAIAKVKQSYPHMPCTFSHVGLLNLPEENKEDIGFLDFLDSHVWMVAANNEEFNKRINYNYARFTA